MQPMAHRTAPALHPLLLSRARTSRAPFPSLPRCRLQFRSNSQALSVRSAPMPKRCRTTTRACSTSPRTSTSARGTESSPSIMMVSTPAASKSVRAASSQSVTLPASLPSFHPTPPIRLTSSSALVSSTTSRPKIPTSRRMNSIRLRWNVSRGDLSPTSQRRPRKSSTRPSRPTSA